MIEKSPSFTAGAFLHFCGLRQLDQALEGRSQVLIWRILRTIMKRTNVCLKGGVSLAREYFCAYHSYIHQCRGLSDSELGRLFRALLEYSASGELPSFKGRTAVAFDFISANIDRDMAQYELTRKKNRENVSKRYERMRSNTSECQSYQEKEEEEKKKKKM